uniref:Thioesterase domain-containing protein n=1 Tax=Oryza punctata TaxID=4537 RepID=A0A0E0JRU7_ORYPU
MHGAAAEALRKLHDDGIMDSKLYDVFTIAGLRVDAIQPGRVLCSFTAQGSLIRVSIQPPRILLWNSTERASLFLLFFAMKNASSKRMHGGAVASLVDLVGSAVFFAGGSPTTGVSVEITVSYLAAARVNEEI